VAWGRYVVGADELWLVSTRVPNSWDGRYVGPISTSLVWSVARPGWTVDCYLLRPAVAQDRLRLLDDGRVVLTLKRAWVAVKPREGVSGSLR